MCVGVGVYISVCGGVYISVGGVYISVCVWGGGGVSFVGRSDVPATCSCASGSDLFRQPCVLPH